ALSHVLEHGPLTGTRDPKAWNQRFGTTKTRLIPERTPNDKPGGSLDQFGNDATGQYAQPGQDVDLSGAQGSADAATPSQKQAAYNEALFALKDAVTGAPLKLTPQQAQAKVAAVLGGFGWHMNPGSGVPAFAQNIVNTWGMMDAPR